MDLCKHRGIIRPAARVMTVSQIQPTDSDHAGRALRSTSGTSPSRGRSSHNLGISTSTSVRTSIDSLGQTGKWSSCPTLSRWLRSGARSISTRASAKSDLIATCHRSRASLRGGLGSHRAAEAEAETEEELGVDVPGVSPAQAADRHAANRPLEDQCRDRH